MRQCGVRLSGIRRVICLSSLFVPGCGPNRTGAANKVHLFPQRPVAVRSLGEGVAPWRQIDRQDRREARCRQVRGEARGARTLLVCIFRVEGS
jgi:hypothetical protein